MCHGLINHHSSAQVADFWAMCWTSRMWSGVVDWRTGVLDLCWTGRVWSGELDCGVVCWTRVWWNGGSEDTVYNQNAIWGKKIMSYKKVHHNYYYLHFNFVWNIQKLQNMWSKSICLNLGILLSDPPWGLSFNSHVANSEWHIKAMFSRCRGIKKKYERKKRE